VVNPRHIFLVLFVAASTTWLVWIAALPSLLGTSPVPRPLVLAAAFTYRIGSVVCHQDPARSFATAGIQVPVCARCTGLYAGAVLGALLALRWRTGRRRRAAGLAGARLVLVACALPTAVLWLAEWLLGLGVDNVDRCVSAAPLGAAVAWVIGLAIAGQLPTDTPPASGVH
jgi:hypothetical protein